MKTIRLSAAICLCIVALNAVSFGQTKDTVKYKYNTWSATLSGGSMLFYGDIRQFDFYPLSKQNCRNWYSKHLGKNSNGISERNMGFGLAVNKYFTPSFAVQLQAQQGNLSGVRIKLDKYFKATFMEYGANGIVNFGNLFFHTKNNHKFTAYGFLGFSFIDFKTMMRTIKTDSILHSYGYGDFGQKKKRTTEVAVPVGLGVKYKINNHFDIGIESQLVNVNTDKLDARKKLNTAKDKYGYTSIGVTYKIGKNEKSLEWTSPKEMETDQLSPLFNAMNKKIDSLSNKLKDIDGKVGQIQKDVYDLKNPAKEADDDGDGVPNSRDLEPNTPKGALVDVNGREIKIPQISSTATGSPQFAVFFAFNSADIDEANEQQVAAAAKMLKNDANMKFAIIGHADKVGGEDYNQKLSEKRAKAVYDDLVKSYGIDAGRLTIVGKGKLEPLSNNADAVNRRVDFIIKK